MANVLAFETIDAIITVSFKVSGVLMSIRAVYEVVRIINALDDVKGEKQLYGLADICKWSNLSRATINRGLIQAEKSGFVKVELLPYKGKLARRWGANRLMPKDSFILVF